MTATPVLVRVQAKGGKFLGPDAGYSQVTITDAASGTVLAEGTAQGGSGTLTADFVSTASRQAIVTAAPGGQSLSWLSATADPPTAGLSASLQLGAPTLVRFTAEALTDGSPNGHIVTQTMSVNPGDDLSAEPGVVLVIPGLIVQIRQCAVAAPVPSLTVTAWVTMMCGCKIAPSSPWLPAEFEVTAVVTDVSGAVVARAPLAFQTTSTFGVRMPLHLPPGDYTLTVNALQPAEANAGSASTPFTLAPVA
jgi:hypothetical protein